MPRKILLKLCWHVRLRPTWELQRYLMNIKLRIFMSISNIVIRSMNLAYCNIHTHILHACMFVHAFTHTNNIANGYNLRKFVFRHSHVKAVSGKNIFAL